TDGYPDHHEGHEEHEGIRERNVCHRLVPMLDAGAKLMAMASTNQPRHRPPDAFGGGSAVATCDAPSFVARCFCFCSGSAIAKRAKRAKSLARPLLVCSQRHQSASKEQ